MSLQFAGPVNRSPAYKLTDPDRINVPLDVITNCFLKSYIMQHCHLAYIAIHCFWSLIWYDLDIHSKTDMIWPRYSQQNYHCNSILTVQAINMVNGRIVNNEVPQNSIIHQMAWLWLVTETHQDNYLKLNTMQLVTPGGNHCCLIIIIYEWFKLNIGSFIS